MGLYLSDASFRVHLEILRTAGLRLDRFVIYHIKPKSMSKSDL